MPYIGQPRREEMLECAEPQTPGEFNFCVTTLVDQYLERHGLSYTRINEVIGALECAKLELYRRVAVPYEDIKIEENGDVYSKENLGGN